MPSADAAAISAVVLNGTGAATVRFFLSILGNGCAARALYVGHGCVGGVLRLEARRLVRGLEGLLAVAGGRSGGCRRVEGALDRPVVLRHERLTLALAFHDEPQRGGLHAAGRAHVADPGETHDGQVARERRAPDEVDVLARGPGLGEVRVHVHQVAERALDLGLRERRVACSRRWRRLVDLAAARQGVCADQLAFAVEVGRDDDRVGLLRQVLQRADDVLLLGKLLDGRVRKVGQRVHLPRLQLDAVRGERLLLLEGGLGKRAGDVGLHELAVLGHALPSAALLVHQLVREVRFQDVPAQTDGDAFLAVVVELVHGGVVNLVLLGLLRAEQVCYLLGGIVLLGNYQLQGRS